MSLVVALLLGFALRCAHERFQQAWRGRVVHALGGQAPGRAAQWLGRAEAHPGRVVLSLLVCIVLAKGLGVVVETARAAEAKAVRDKAAIEKHHRWLDSLPDAEKRRWPLAHVCHPASASGGACYCYDWGAYITWMERLENGDVACHAQR